MTIRYISRVFFNENEFPPENIRQKQFFLDDNNDSLKRKYTVEIMDKENPEKYRSFKGVCFATANVMIFFFDFFYSSSYHIYLWDQKYRKEPHVSALLVGNKNEVVPNNNNDYTNNNLNVHNNNDVSKEEIKLFRK
eukprot:gb/GECH01009231.1/.p1 GENE.gb/GECH01009231.1/~~gb/GECH01009231.1/.p1  ORF type:complete len:136 (+),score=30.81 gb/GECH01009231.1/:1-408(+)